jgi:uncharacterized membrane protein YgdD (TMEM256/DUF423 family)
MRLWSMILAALGGLLGAAGVGLAAAAAHLSGEPSAAIAANFLLFHAAALLAITALNAARPHPLLLVAGFLMVIGAVLFSGDLALRAFAALRLIPMGAPAGGIILILGWIVAAVGGVAAQSRR